MLPRELLTGSILVLAIAAPALAQRPSVTPEDTKLHNSLQTFEVVLQRAVRQGGDAFARQENDFIPPGVQLFSDDPRVQGFAPPHSGEFFFYVAVPEIRVVINQVFLQRSAPREDPIRQAARRAGPERIAGAQAIPGGDEMTVSPVQDDGRCATRVKPSRGGADPNYEYAVAVCDALMDAMLDNSGALPIKEDEWLTIAAVNGEDSPRLVNSTAGIATYLEIKGADLLQFRLGKISKEEARKLVELTQR